MDGRLGGRKIHGTDSWALGLTGKRLGQFELRPCSIILLAYVFLASYFAQQVGHRQQAPHSTALPGKSRQGPLPRLTRRWTSTPQLCCVNLGNFKGTLLSSVGKSHGISKSCAFQLLKDCDQQVTVGMREFMHKEVHTGLTRKGVFTGPPHGLFVGGIPKVKDTSPFELKTLDDNIYLGQNSATLRLRQQKVEGAVYPDGEKRCPS